MIYVYSVSDESMCHYDVRSTYSYVRTYVVYSSSVYMDIFVAACLFLTRDLPRSTACAQRDVHTRAIERHERERERV